MVIVHQVEGNNGRVLLDIDVQDLLAMVAALGNQSNESIRRTIINMGFSAQQAAGIDKLTDTSYGELEDVAIELAHKYYGDARVKYDEVEIADECDNDEDLSPLEALLRSLQGEE